MIQIALILPEEAKNFSCCTMPGRCSGETCMAWKWDMVSVVNPDFDPKACPDDGDEYVARTINVRSGKGFCAMADR